MICEQVCQLRPQMCGFGAMPDVANCLGVGRRPAVLDGGDGIIICHREHRKAGIGSERVEERVPVEQADPG